MPNQSSFFLAKLRRATSTVVLEAMDTRLHTNVCFKLDAGADVTVISANDYKNAGSP